MPAVPKWRNVGHHNFSQKITTHAFEWLCALIMPMRITMAKKLCECIQRLNNYGLQSGCYRQLRAYSNPKWPVEWVANWSIIIQSASTRGQNRSPTPPPGGRGTPLKKISRYREALHGSSGCRSPCHERCLKPQTPNGQWRGSPFDQKCPNGHELKDKKGPQHPPWGLKCPQCSIFRPNRATGSCWRLGTIL